MSVDQSALARKNIEKRLAPLRDERITAPPRGWTRAIREALGLTTRQLAKRLGVAPSRIPAIEKAESTGATTLKTLREAAEAMNCTLIYAFVPTKPLDEILRDQAARKAAVEISRLDHSMRLENQAMTASDLADERRRMIDDLLTGSLRSLWDDE
jgi:predicted DNA-binding mobile mystery protein A